MTPYFEAENIVLYCADALEAMREMPVSEVVVTDPPYGIGENNEKNLARGKLAQPKDYGHYDWDRQRAGKEYIDEILRASKNQVIFGGNYYSDLLPQSNGWIVWDKENTGDFSDCELTWTSYKRGVRLVRWMWNGMLGRGNEERFHPTQKPLGVMLWIVERYTKVGDTILDPFAGSGSTLVAALKLGRKCIGIEIDQHYADIAVKRIREALAQPRLL